MAYMLRGDRSPADGGSRCNSQQPASHRCNNHCNNWSNYGQVIVLIDLHCHNLLTLRHFGSNPLTAN